MFLDTRIKLCKTQQDTREPEPVINFNHLDQILRLKNNLESELHNDEIFTLEASEENLRQDLAKIHQFSNNQDFSLNKVRYKLGNPVKSQPLDLTKLFDTVLTLCQDKLKTKLFYTSPEILKSNIQFLEKIKKLWSEISSSEVTPTENKSKVISETPVLLLEHIGHGRYSGTRVIVNPKFEKEARACSKMYSVGWTIDNFRRALELGDHRVKQIFIDDPDESVKLTNIKYLDLGKEIINPNWESRAINYLSELARQGKVKDSQGQLLAA